MQTLSRKLIFPLLAGGLLFVGCGKKQASNSNFVSIVLGATIESNGLLPANTGGDGQIKPGRIADTDCQELFPKENRSDCHLYLQVDPAFKKDLPPSLTVTVEYFDEAPTHFYLQYDSAIEGNGGGPYTPSKERIDTKGLQEWQKAKFILEHPAFTGRQNGKGDFRIRVERPHQGQFFIRSVMLSRD
jgi:hypothetical protein